MLRILLYVLLIVFSNNVLATNLLRDTICLYDDDGVDQECLRHWEAGMHGIVRDKITCVDAATLRTGDWIKNARILVIGGGKATPYHSKLQGTGYENIRKFVSCGGIYIGFCAGAYLAARISEFAKGAPNEVCASRELQLFSGTARGPVLKPFTYGSCSGACAAKISVIKGGESFFCYYNGGCEFLVDDDKRDDVEVLALYDDKKPAVIKCKFGDGYSILSGVHLECSPEKLKEIPYAKGDADIMNEIIEQLTSTDEVRARVFEKMLT